MAEDTSKSRLSVRFWQILLLAILLVVLAVMTFRHVYYLNLKPVSDNPKTVVFTVEKGSSMKEISSQLDKQELIRSAWAFNTYVSFHRLSTKLQAGTYALSPADSTPHIVNLLTNGRVETKLVTILPGARIDQIRATLINDGFSPEAVDNALNPATYADMPLMAIKPAEINTLEGLLWPDSYQKGPSTLPQEIIRQSLEATEARITPEVKQNFANLGLTPYQGIIMTSIILQEVSKPAEQPQVAQVFYSRLSMGMKLQSDPTVKYGAILAGQGPSLTYDSPYNTFLYAGLPPTPISNLNESSLYAATHPASTKWLYFVAGDDGKTYFSTNLKDHEALTQKHCRKLCNN